VTSHSFLYAGIGILVLLVVGVAAAVYLLPGSSTTSNGVVQVVAAENFWGSLASQLGGSHANVVSIVTDPNADPHSYESNPQNATAVAKANLVIENGGGYDDWMLHLVSASNTPNQKVLNVANLLAYDEADLTHFSNEHFWYNPTFVNKTVNAMYKDYIAIDPSNSAYYKQQYSNLNASLYKYMTLEAQIKQQFGGTKVASTETIFLYMANATGLNVVSPFGFMKAVATGNDPSAQDVAAFHRLLDQPGVVKMLIYNSQTASPITASIQQQAVQNKIPVVAVTETLQPVNVTFQTWMITELTSVQNALKGQ
jgi:zinc/manganese transport system substrate-binding protein